MFLHPTRCHLRRDRQAPLAGPRLLGNPRPVSANCRRQTTRRRWFETLERRMVLCQNNLVPGELLEIVGDNGANAIEVRDAGSLGVSVTCDGSVLVERAIVDRVVVRSLGGPDTINYHLLGGPDTSPNDHRVLDVTLDSGGGADEVNYSVAPPPDPEKPGFVGAAPDHLRVNLGSTFGSDDAPQRAAAAAALDTFSLDAAAGWVLPPDADHPATIDVLGGRGSQRAGLMFGNIGTPPPDPEMPSAGLMIHMGLGDGDDSGDVAYGTGIYVPVALNAELGGGNDAFTATIMPGKSASPAGGTLSMNVRGGPGDDTFMMNVGDPNSPPPDPEVPPPEPDHFGVPLDVNVDGGVSSDSILIGLLNVALDGRFNIAATGGGGNDTFSAKLQNVQLGGTTGREAAAHIFFDGRGGSDHILIGLLRIAGADLAPQTEAVADVREAALDIDIATGDGNDSVNATVQDIGVDLHLDTNLGGGGDAFTATVMPDTAVGPGGGCIDASVQGGAGNDKFSVAVGDVNTPGPDDNTPLPQLSAELMLNLDGAEGGDSFLVGLLNVAVDGPVTIMEDGGGGNDSFRDTFSQVAAGGGAWNIAHQGGAGNDSLHSSFFDVFADLSIGADLGSGNDSAVIAIIRNGTTPSELVPAVHIQVAGGEGSDDVTLAVDRAIEDFTALLDGGPGRDGAHVTQNVKDKGVIVNFEQIAIIP